MVKTKLIVNRTRDRALCVGELADKPLLRMRGLLGRSGLPAGEGMLLTPAPSIHTAFMRFPIDALFLDRELRVIKIVEKLGPWRVASKARARAVLELAAGESARSGVMVGDVLELRDRMREENGRRGPGRRISLRGGAQRTASEGIVETAIELPRMAPMRVLLVSPDRHYRTAMSMLLARRNCSVRMVPSFHSLDELLEDDRYDVALVDAGTSDVRASLAALEAFASPIGVIVVADHDAQPLEGHRALPKWGPFDELMARIEDVSASASAEGSNGKH
jgi:uncharacterized protein